MTLDRVLEEALAWHEAFRRLGFAPESIFLAVIGDEVRVVLRDQGREFGGTAGHWRGTQDELHRAWRAAVEAWNHTGPRSWRERVWRESFVANNSVELAIRMLSKGFTLKGALTCPTA